MFGRPRFRKAGIGVACLFRPAVLLSLCAVFSCHTQPFPSTRGAPPPTSTRGILETQEMPAVSKRMSALAAYLRQQGYKPLDSTLIGRISPRETLTISHEAPDACRLLVIALSAADQVPLDMDVLDEDEQLITLDRTPAHRSVVTFVANSQKRFAVRLIAGTASKRAGFALGVFQAPLATPAAEVFELFEHDPVPRLDLDALTHRLAGLGFRNEQQRFYNRVTSGGTIVRQLELRPHQCYMFAASGSPAVDAVTLRLKKDGRTLVSDLSGRPDATCHYCPASASTVEVIIKVTAGAGSVSYRVFSAPHPLVGGVFGPESTSRRVPEDTACRLGALADQLKRLGFAPPQVRAELVLSEGERAAVNFEVPGGCYLWARVGETTLIDVDASLTDHKGFQSDPRYRSDPEFPFCCEKKSCRYTADFVALEGHGTLVAATFAVGKSPAGTEGQTSFAQAVARSVFARSGLALSNPHLSWSPIDPQEDTAASEIFPIPAGACRGFALTPASPDMELSLVSTQGARLASASSPLYDSLLLVHCAKKESFVRLRCVPAAACRKSVLSGFGTNTERAP